MCFCDGTLRTPWCNSSECQEELKRRSKPHPLTPLEVFTKPTPKPIPDWVFLVFNELLKGAVPLPRVVPAYLDKTIYLPFEGIVDALLAYSAAQYLGFSLREILDNEWFDVMVPYREAGWDVQYEPPTRGLDLTGGRYRFTPVGK